MGQTQSLPTDEKASGEFDSGSRRPQYMPTRRRHPVRTWPCSLASSCWCRCWEWPCTARTAGARSECARSWRRRWPFTFCTWSNCCGAAGYGLPCNDWDQTQGEQWSLLDIFTPLYYLWRCPGIFTPQPYTTRPLFAESGAGPHSQWRRESLESQKYVASVSCMYCI